MAWRLPFFSQKSFTALRVTGLLTVVQRYRRMEPLPLLSEKTGAAVFRRSLWVEEIAGGMAGWRQVIQPGGGLVGIRAQGEGKKREKTREKQESWRSFLQENKKCNLGILEVKKKKIPEKCSKRVFVVFNQSKLNFSSTTDLKRLPSNCSNKNVNTMAILLVTFLGWWKRDRLESLSDLQLQRLRIKSGHGGWKITWHHLGFPIGNLLAWSQKFQTDPKSQAPYCWWFRNPANQLIW